MTINSPQQKNSLSFQKITVSERVVVSVSHYSGVFYKYRKQIWGFWKKQNKKQTNKQKQKQNKTKQNKNKQKQTKQNKTKQKQTKTKQNKSKQNKTKTKQNKQTNKQKTEIWNERSLTVL